MNIQRVNLCGLIGERSEPLLGGGRKTYCRGLPNVMFIYIYIFLPYIHILESILDFIDPTGYGHLGYFARINHGNVGFGNGHQ